MPGVETVASGRFRRAVSICEHPGVVEVHCPRAGHIEILAHVPALRGLVDVVSRCRRVFRLDHLDDGPPGVWSQFETDVVATIRGSSSEPRDVLEQLVARYGAPVPGAEALGITHRFPSPQTLAGIDVTGIDGLDPPVTATIVELARSRSGLHEG